MSATDWLSLCMRLTPADPLTYSTEGLDDGCFWCGAYTAWDGRAMYAVHEPNCEWVEARQALGYDLAPHRVSGTP